ncbi:UNVERIFIED_CONTAM: hypothetical protein Sradi_1088000 [Sesamum radiatum]|uniref:Uncharacterized protein n=1 Tax=Sesamum radiatum TaxID=300843 RepID=A0AAW2V8D8_SESRA
MVNCITLNSTSRVVLASCRNAFTMLRESGAAVFLNRLKREAHEKGHARISWTYWFNKLLYYQVALVYVLTRLVTNVSQVPAVIYICSFIISILLQEVTWTGQRLKAFYSAGGLLWIISGAAILFLPSSMKAFMYILSIAIGIANALMMVRLTFPLHNFTKHLATDRRDPVHTYA